MGVVTYVFGLNAAPSKPVRPHIDGIKWGQIEVVKPNGKTKMYPHDVKIWPTKVGKWDWNKTGTHHKPGIQPADIEEFIDECAVVKLCGR